MSKKLFVLMIPVILMTLLISCAQGSVAEDAKTAAVIPPAKIIGLSQFNSAYTWFIAENNSIKNAVEGQGSTFLFGAGDGTQAVQIAAVRSFIAQKANAIILIPVVAAGWDAVLGETKTAGTEIKLNGNLGTIANGSAISRLSTGLNTIKIRGSANYTRMDTNPFTKAKIALNQLNDGVTSSDTIAEFDNYKFYYQP